MANNKRMQCEIRKLLSEPVSRTSDPAKTNVSKRCQVLASFLKTLLGDVSHQQELTIDLPAENDFSASTRDSVEFGEISPHRNNYGSISSTEIPPTYNQLNYNENLCRFFNSEPSTVGNNEVMKIDSDIAVNSNDCEPKNVFSPMEQCYEESGGSRSTGNSSTESNEQMDCNTQYNTSETSTRSSTGDSCLEPATLTEAILIKHNDEMENIMLKKHKDARCNSRSTIVADKIMHVAAEKGNGVKRSCSHSWTGVAQKNCKQNHEPGTPQMSPNAIECVHLNEMITQSAIAGPSPFAQITSETNMSRALDSRPFSTMCASANTNIADQFASSSGLFSAIHYMSATTQPNAPNTPQENPSSNETPYATVQYMAGLMYPHLAMYGQPFGYSQPSFLYQTVPMPTMPSTSNSLFNVCIRRMRLYRSHFESDLFCTIFQSNDGGKTDPNESALPSYHMPMSQIDEKLLEVRQQSHTCSFMFNRFNNQFVFTGLAR